MGILGLFGQFPRLPPLPAATLSPSSASVMGLDVGRLFPLITPSSAPAPSPGITQAFPVITPSPAATSAPDPGPAQTRRRASTTGKDLALSEQLTGSRQVGLIFALLIAGGAATWLLLGRARRRQPALSLAHAGLSSPAASPPGVAPPAPPQTGTACDDGLPSPAGTPPPAAASAPPAAAPSRSMLLRPVRARRRTDAADRNLAPAEPRTGRRPTGRSRTGLVCTLLVAGAAVAWLLLGRARKRPLP